MTRAKCVEITFSTTFLCATLRCTVFLDKNLWHKRAKNSNHKQPHTCSNSYDEVVFGFESLTYSESHFQIFRSPNDHPLVIGAHFVEKFSVN